MKKVKLGNPLLQLQSVDSTNNYASRLLRQEKVAEGTVILADYQTDGRGQGGNAWISDKEMNLLFSLILKPDLPVSRQFYLSMAVCVGIQEFVSEQGIPAQIKWPNDILAGHRKLSGILIENTVMGSVVDTSVIGIGLNMNQLAFPPDVPEASSLALETGKTFDLSPAFQKLLTQLERWIQFLYDDRLSEIKTAYLNRLWRLNTWLILTDQSGKFRGRIADVADTGELIVKRQNGGTRLYGFKEISF